MPSVGEFSVSMFASGAGSMTHVTDAATPCVPNWIRRLVWLIRPVTEMFTPEDPPAGAGPPVLPSALTRSPADGPSYHWFPDHAFPGSEGLKSVTGPKAPPVR